MGIKNPSTELVEMVLKQIDDYRATALVNLKSLTTEGTLTHLSYRIPDHIEPSDVEVHHNFDNFDRQVTLSWEFNNPEDHPHIYEQFTQQTGEMFSNLEFDDDETLRLFTCEKNHPESMCREILLYPSNHEKFD